METTLTKELIEVKQQVSKALIAANNAEIKSQLTFERATDILSEIKTVGKIIKARKEAITKPLMVSINSVRDLFKPIEQSHEEAERIIKSKMLQYQDEQEKAQEEERARLAARVDKGTMKMETAIEKMENMKEVPTNAKGKFGAISTRIITKVRITDENQIPREYLIPDMAKINEAVLKQGKTISGVETYEEKVIAAK